MKFLNASGDGDLLLNRIKHGSDDYRLTLKMVMFVAAAPTLLGLFPYPGRDGIRAVISAFHSSSVHGSLNETTLENHEYFPQLPCKRYSIVPFMMYPILTSCSHENCLNRLHQGTVLLQNRGYI